MINQDLNPPYKGKIVEVDTVSPSQIFNRQLDLDGSWENEKIILEV